MKKSNYYPIYFSLVLLIGFYLGSLTNKRSSSLSNKKLSKFIHSLENDYVDPIDVDSIVDLSIVEIVKHLDPHSRFIEPESMTSIKEEMEGGFEGVGIEYQIYKDTLVVVNTIKDGPSHKAGILKGDRILKVDTSLISGIELSSKEIVSRIRGKKGSKAEVFVKRDTALLTFDVFRDKIPLNSIDITYKVNNSTAYVKISRFSQETGNEFDEVVDFIIDEDVENVILDLRNNPGGILGGAIHISEYFLKNKDLIVYTKGRKRGKQSYYAEKDGLLSDLNVCVLINENTASASEIVAGALQDNDRATIIGKRSFGKGLVQQQFMYQDGSAARLTTSRYYTPSGRSIQRSYKNGNDEYYKDFYKRADNGELINEDSVPVADSLKFFTKNGKVVYGGGGIYPDIFVPDSILYDDLSDNVRMLLIHDFINDFSFRYVDDNRKKLEKQGLQSFIAEFKIDDKILNALIDEAIKEKILLKKFNLSLEDSSFIKKRLKLAIANKNWSSEGFYHQKNKTDKEVLKALETF